MTPFARAFWITAIPLVALSLLSTAGAAADYLYIAWFVALLGWLTAPIVALVFGLTKRGEIASGILAGFGVGFLALAATCFANLSYSN